MSLSGEEAKALAIGDAPLDYEALGFKCGLEIHQQLDTRKLFSPCPSEVVDPDAVEERAIAQYDRRLRATQSELGETDAAVLAESKRRRAFRYLALDGVSSLVELDEEPPHPMDAEALDVTLTYAGLLGARPADEVHVMRKTVIDGSNTSGFQRTALVATGGRVDPTPGDANDDVGIWTIAVEEDSARKLDDAGSITTYTLDRLGIPLIEVATAPDIRDPKHAQATAARLGGLLRATGKVRRGLGSIRQDLNVSVAVGDRVEIKGCQDLRAVPKVIENEVRRQLWLHYVAETLRARGYTPDMVGEPVDVSDALADCEGKIVRGALKKGGKVMALVLPKWAGLIQGHEGRKDLPRYGSEFAAHAKVRAGVKGVFHSDELPAYGIAETDVAKIAQALDLGNEDAYVLCVEQEAVARSALEGVADCARDAPSGAGRAVRAAQPDDSSRYMRPLPGAARMYPETDVPPITITQQHWEGILEALPAKPEERIASYVEAHGISQDLATQILREGVDAEFDAWTQEGVEPAMAGRILLQLLPELEGDVDAARAMVPALAKELAAGRFAKEAVPDILAAIAKDPQAGLDGAIQAAGAEAADESEVDAIIDGVVASRLDFVKERGMGAMGPLMGPVMAELRGKADGAVISAKLKAAIQKHL